MLENNFEVIFAVADMRSIARASAFADVGARPAFDIDVVSFAVGVTSLAVSCLALWPSFHFPAGDGYPYA